MLSNQAKTMAGVERKCLEFLANGGAFAQNDIQEMLRKGHRGGMPFIWDALINMEHSWLVCRASDYENPKTYHQWKITGCGLLSLAAVSRS